jgi:hypothetical protein
LKALEKPTFHQKDCYQLECFRRSQHPAVVAAAREAVAVVPEAVDSHVEVDAVVLCVAVDSHEEVLPLTEAAAEVAEVSATADAEDLVADVANKALSCKIKVLVQSDCLRGWYF